MANVPGIGSNKYDQKGQMHEGKKGDSARQSTFISCLFSVAISIEQEEEGSASRILLRFLQYSALRVLRHHNPFWTPFSAYSLPRVWRPYPSAQMVELTVSPLWHPSPGNRESGKGSLASMS